MGYYSRFDYYIKPNTKVNPKRVKSLLKLFSNPNESNVSGFFNVELTIESDYLKGIQPEDYYAKFYDDELFAFELSKCITQGLVDL